MKELGILVKLNKDHRLVCETLERIGVINNKSKKFYPSCYCIAEEDGTFRVYHFKELFEKEGKASDYNDIDELRRNTIVHLVRNWGLIETDYEIDTILHEKIDVLRHEQKKEYTICHKYYFKRKL